MTSKNRRIQRAFSVALIAAALSCVTACNAIDLSTEEGLREALSSRQKLDKAIPKIASMTKPEEVNKYIDELVKLYAEGSSFDRDIIAAIATSANKDKIHESLVKAAKSDDYKQVMSAANGAKKTEDTQVIDSLLSRWNDKKVGVNPEVRRVILEAGTAFKSATLTAKAVEVLNGQLDETPFNIMRTSCDVLAYQADPSAVDTIMRVVYHQDGVGRTLSANCTRALLALDKDVVGPVLLKAYKLENKELMAYVDAHPDTLTPESIRNNTSNALALYRYQEAVEPMLDYLETTRTIPVPGTLAIRPATDPAWQMWASLVGLASQSTLFAITDIGIRNNQRAKKILTDIFNWEMPYQSKFKNAIELTGTSNIEVSQRVNAFRALRENDLLSNDEVLAMVESLKDDEFLDEQKWRPYARASIGTDMVTYSAVMSRPGDTDTIWRAFNALKAEQFKVPETAPDAPKVDHYNDNVSKRIDDTKAAFELADKCSNSYTCYADYLKGENVDGYARIKAVHELGLSGDHQFFKVICDEYKNLDVFGQIYGTKALANLGTPDDVETIQELNQTLSREMNQIQYTAAKTNLEGLMTTLRSK